MKGSRVTIAATATLIATHSDQIEHFKRVVVKNGATACDLGGSTVTSGAGYACAANETVTFDLAPGDALYGITASGTSAASVLAGGK